MKLKKNNNSFPPPNSKIPVLFVRKMHAGKGEGTPLCPAVVPPAGATGTKQWCSCSCAARDVYIVRSAGRGPKPPFLVVGTAPRTHGRQPPGDGSPLRRRCAVPPHTRPQGKWDAAGTDPQQPWEIGPTNCVANGTPHVYRSVAQAILVIHLCQGCFLPI